MALYHLGALYHFSLASVDSVTTHEEGIFFASMLVLWMVLQIYRAEPAQRRTLAILLPLFVIAFFAAKRRAAMVALVFAVPYLLMMVDWPRARRMLLAGVLAVPLIVGYTAVFWNSTSAAALPVGLLKSLFVSGEVGRMESSNLYRLVENEILTSRIRENPLTGMGFGHLFVYGGGTIVDESGKTKAMDLAVSSAPLAHFIAHNQILWLWSMGGLLSFAAFWFFVTFAVAHGTRLVRTLQTPHFKAVALQATLLLCMQMFVSYGDQQLTEYRTMVYLGMMLGVMVRLRAIEQREALEGSPPSPGKP
jgi:O-antigen ligase